MLPVRTTPRDQCTRSTDGLTLFYTGLGRDFIEVRKVAEMGRAAVDSNTIFIDCLPAPEDHRIGQEGRQSVLTPEQWRALCAKVPVGRLGEPDEVTAVIEVPSGPESVDVTGQVWHVNGGLL